MAEDSPARVRWRDASWEGRGRRIGTWCFLAFAAWFIVRTVLQIAEASLSAEAPAAWSNDGGPATDPCFKRAP